MTRKLYFIPTGTYTEIEDSAIPIIHALEMVFGNLPLELGTSQRDRLIAMHYAYNAARSQHGRTTPFGEMAEAIQKYDRIMITTSEEIEDEC